jgi:hypothetical protein
LQLDTGFSLDLTTIPNTAIKNIQEINLTNGSANTLTLDAGDVVDMTAFPLNTPYSITHAPGHSLIISGEAADSVNLSSANAPMAGAWQLVTNGPVNLPNTNQYNIYDFVSSGQVLASVAIDQAVTQIIT